MEGIIDNQVMEGIIDNQVMEGIIDNQVKYTNVLSIILVRTYCLLF
jgi:hypothetical protein